MCSLNSALKRIKPSNLSWIILFVAATNAIFLGGLRKAFGGFVAQLHKDFGNVTLMELNWIGNSYSAAGHFLSGISTMILLYFNRPYCLFQFIGSMLILLSGITCYFVPNPHWLFITHSLIHGVGSALILSVTSLIVIEYFDTKHPYRIFATSIVSGGAIASIVFVPLYTYLIQRFNWKNTLLILGLVYFIVSGSAAFFFKRNENISEIENQKYNFRLKNIKCPQIPLMVLWFIEKLITATVIHGLLLNLTDYLYRNQNNLVQSSILTTIFAAGEGVSFITTIIVTVTSKTLLKGKIGFVLVATSSTSVLSLIGMEFTKNIMAMEGFLCFMAGLGLGFSITLNYAASEELTRLPGHVSNTFSLVGIGTGMLVSPLLSGKLAEIFQYKWFFLIQGLLTIVKVICIACMMVLLYCYDKNDVDVEYVDEVELTLNDPKESHDFIKKTTEMI